MNKLVTLHMIVKNEEALLDGCLRSVKDFVDEIVIVDTGSTDRTKSIANQYTDRIYDFKWVNDFGAARNFALSKVNTPWAMWLDADDICLNPENIKALCRQAHKERANGIWTLYQQDSNTTQRRLHLFKTKDFNWSGVVHENPISKKPAYFMSDITVYHRKPKERSPQAAKQYLDILLEKDPENHFGLAESYRYLSVYPDDPKNVDDYQNNADTHYWAAANCPDVNDPTLYICLLHLSELNFERRNKNKAYFQAALRYAQAGVALSPERAECWVALGQVWHSSGDYSKANEAYNQALMCELPFNDVGVIYQHYYNKLPEAYLKQLNEDIAVASTRKLHLPQSTGLILPK